MLTFFLGGGALRELQQQIALLTEVIKEGFQTMATALDDLTASVTNLGTSLSNELAAVATALSNAKQPDGSVSAADVETAVTNINALAAKLDAETAALTTPAPPAAPAPTT